MSAAAPPKRDPEATATSYVVLDPDDRIVRVGAGLYDRFGPFVGQVIWLRIPGAEPLYGPHFDEARLSGQPVQTTVFYAAELKRLRATPSGRELIVHIDPIRDLDVRTLESLAESLRTMESELAARESVPRDRPALVSPPARP
jgi:hypothetical protein